MKKDCPVCNIDCVGEWDTLIDCSSNCGINSTKISKYTIKTFKEGQALLVTIITTQFKPVIARILRVLFHVKEIGLSGTFAVTLVTATRR